MREPRMMDTFTKWRRSGFCLYYGKLCATLFIDVHISSQTLKKVGAIVLYSDNFTSRCKVCLDFPNYMLSRTKRGLAGFNKESPLTIYKER